MKGWRLQNCFSPKGHVKLGPNADILTLEGVLFSDKKGHSELELPLMSTNKDALLQMNIATRNYFDLLKDFKDSNK